MTHQSNFFWGQGLYPKLYKYHYLVGKPTHPFNALCAIYPHVEVAFKDKFAHVMGQKDPNEWIQKSEYN